MFVYFFYSIYPSLDESDKSDRTTDVHAENIHDMTQSSKLNTAFLFNISKVYFRHTLPRDVLQLNLG